MSEPTANAAEPLWTPPAGGPVVAEDLVVDVGSALLRGRLQLPATPIGLAVVAHGSGTGLHSQTNHFLADILNTHRIATLVVDLLTTAEALDHLDELDVELSGSRLVLVRRWLRNDPRCLALPLAYLGVGAGAPAVLWAAADDAMVSAVVAHGPRPDAAGLRLLAVTAPTLLVVGSRDPAIRQHNERALALLGRRPHLAVVAEPRYFADSAVIEAVAQRAADWFVTHLEPEAGAARDGDTRHASSGH